MKLLITQFIILISLIINTCIGSEYNLTPVESAALKKLQVTLTKQINNLEIDIPEKENGDFLYRVLTDPNLTRNAGIFVGSEFIFPIGFHLFRAESQIVIDFMKRFGGHKLIGGTIMAVSATGMVASLVLVFAGDLIFPSSVADATILGQYTTKEGFTKFLEIVINDYDLAEQYMSENRNIAKLVIKVSEKL